jgi:hypothetical protein
MPKATPRPLPIGLPVPVFSRARASFLSILPAAPARISMNRHSQPDLTPHKSRMQAETIYNPNFSDGLPPQIQIL